MRKPQTVDLEVSRAKFDREVARYRALDPVYRAQGRFLIDAAFPEVFAVFAAVRVKPPALVAGVVIDFTDYDLQPPSVTFVNPLTREPLLFKDLGFAMLRRPPGMTAEAFTAILQAGGQPGMVNIIQSFGQEGEPFLCLPGVREYHDNPGHTGDPWLLHRGSSEGSLDFILEKIWAYGTNPIEALQITVNATMVIPVPSATRIPA